MVCCGVDGMNGVDSFVGYGWYDMILEWCVIVWLTCYDVDGLKGVDMDGML